MRDAYSSRSRCRIRDPSGSSSGSPIARAVTLNIEDNPVRGALTAAIVTFSASLNAVICAEGVETQRQLVALQKVGVATAQGYFLALPGPLPLPLITERIWPSRAGLPARRVLGSPAVADRPRLDALGSLDLLDAAQEEPFQRLTRLAKTLLGAEIALVERRSYAGLANVKASGAPARMVATSPMFGIAWTTRRS